MASVVADRLSRRFAGFTAVNAVSAKIPSGEIRALIGPNGAGKTTFLNLLAGALRPSAGRILLDDRDITHVPIHKRARFGISRSYQVASLFPALSCREVLQLALQRTSGIGEYLSLRANTLLARRAAEALAAAGLDHVAEEESVSISHGLQKRLDIALALAVNARVLLLDEPMAGTTALERLELGRRLRKLAGQRTIIFVEHDMEMVMSLADIVTVMHNGKVIAEGSPREVQNNSLAQHVYLRNGS